jgi:hypothetical protein
VVSVVAGSVCALSVSRIRQREGRHHQADPERLLRERHREGAISTRKYARRLRSFGRSSASDDVERETTDPLGRDIASTKPGGH